MKTRHMPSCKSLTYIHPCPAALQEQRCKGSGAASADGATSSLTHRYPCPAAQAAKVGGSGEVAADHAAQLAQSRNDLRVYQRAGLAQHAAAAAAALIRLQHRLHCPQQVVRRPALSDGALLDSRKA